MSDATTTTKISRARGVFPWMILILLALPAIWHAVDFPDDLDTEFPGVQRPTFSPLPPPAYRLAEPGDTIDRVAIYVSSVAVMLAAAGVLLAKERRGLWVSALGLAAVALWHSATPGPTFDGWHGLGWRVIADSHAPIALRIVVAAAALLLMALIVVPLWARRAEWRRLWGEARDQRIVALLTAAAILVLLRQVEIPGLAPRGYWPRWFFDFGIVAFGLVLVRLMPAIGGRMPRLRRLAYLTTGAAGWFALVMGGIWLTWYHRPLVRFRAVVPDRIYISAMPTGKGLEIAQARHHFKTIINLFPEDTPFRSPHLPEELRFAAKYGIRYLGSPSDEAQASAFLDETLALAQDPAAWPILVHCHGCIDRTPAWMGIYRFIVQGRPLLEILQEIEQHRGYRPKASVTLLFNRALPPRAPERYAADPTAALLRRCVPPTTHDPALSPTPGPKVANPESPPRVSRRAGPRAQLPNLTPSRRSLQYPRAPRDPHSFESVTPS